jgi:hypothetical protein
MPKKICMNISIAIYPFEMRNFMGFMKHFHIHIHHHLCLWSRKTLIFSYLARNSFRYDFHARWIHKVNKEIIRMRVLMKNDAFDCRCMNEFLRVILTALLGMFLTRFFHSSIKYSIYGFHHVHYYIKLFFNIHMAIPTP